MSLDGMAGTAPPGGGAPLQDAARHRGPEPPRADGRRAHQRGRLRARVVRRRRASGRLSQRVAGLERREPPRAGGAHRVAAVLHPHPRGHRLACPADQLPPVPPRQLAVRAQRLHRRLRGDAPRPDARHPSGPVRRGPRIDGHRGGLPPGADHGLEEDPSPRSSARSASSRRPPSATACRTPSRAPSASPTALPLGRALLHASTSRARCPCRPTRLDPAPAPRERALPAPHADDRLIVSEPFSDLPGVWVPVDESTALVVRRGGVVEHRAFRPRRTTAPDDTPVSVA